MSSHSIRRSNIPRQPSIDPDIARSQAAAAASRAMRSSQRSSVESRTSYDRLGGPNNVAVPSRRPTSRLRTDSSSACESLASSKDDRAPTVSERAHIQVESAILSPIIEPKGLDGRDSSVPSSYRRLRKAKSMFSTRQRFPQSSYGTPSISPQSGYDLDHGSGFSFPRTLRHSTSFARGRPGRKLHHAKSHDAAIELARESFVEEAEKTGNLQPSFFTHHQKEHKPFRKTFRATSESSGTGKLSRKASFKSFHRRSRTFSATIKNGLRRVLGLSKTVEQPEKVSSVEKIEPAAHSESPAVPARPIYVRKLTAETEYGYSSSEPSPLRVTAIRSDPSRSMQGIRTTSRASTAVNPIAAEQYSQSFPLVEGHGDLNTQLVASGEATLAPCDQPARLIFDGLINTHDLYTALVRRQLERAAQCANEEIVYGNVPEHRAIPERASSVYSQRSRRTVRTVRRVPSTESSASPRSFATARVDSSSPTKLQHAARYTPQSLYVPNNEKTGPSSAVVEPVSPQSAFIVQDSDEDTESVVARLSPRPESVSPTSLYSRTTSGKTPLASTVSLKRDPSADWQKWFSSEIDKIEMTYPTRGHVREEAQMQDDEEEITQILRQAADSGRGPAPLPEHTEECTVSTRQPSLKAVPQSNFSRPFSRSSSTRTIQSAQKVQTKGEIKVSENEGQTEDLSTISMPIRSISASDRTLSPMRLRYSNTPRIPESPTPPPRACNPSIKRIWTQDQYRRYSARRPTVKAKPAQFRSLRTARESRYNNENARNHEHDDMMDEYHAMQEGPGTMSSKQMVEMFLDSRRRQMGLAENSDGESTVTGEAFM
ncbi:hypothetical protein N7470_006268 [Penicillium chermesinum]|nr:hypothetical protein N7470_006268 [Penicillium chermesinum]